MIHCPNCGGSRPYVQIAVLVSYQPRNFLGFHWLERRPDGARVACQSCGAMFSFGPQGIFDHHPRAYPIMGQPKPEEPRKEAEPNLVDLRPIPKRRPM